MTSDQWPVVSKTSSTLVTWVTGHWSLTTGSIMFLKELISQGWQALMRDRMRSLLTMLGIVWGLSLIHI